MVKLTNECAWRLLFLDYGRGWEPLGEAYYESKKCLLENNPKLNEVWQAFMGWSDIHLNRVNDEDYRREKERKDMLYERFCKLRDAFLAER